MQCWRNRHFAATRSFSLRWRVGSKQQLALNFRRSEFHVVSCHRSPIISIYRAVDYGRQSQFRRLQRCPSEELMCVVEITAGVARQESGQLVHHQLVRVEDWHAGGLMAAALS